MGDLKWSLLLYFQISLGVLLFVLIMIFIGAPLPYYINFASPELKKQKGTIVFITGIII